MSWKHVFAFGVGMLVVPAALAAPECGDLKNHFGPFDYRAANQETRDIVEMYHFTPKVQQLREGETGHLGADIGYLLHVFPNHPRGLYAMAELARREKRAKPLGSDYTVACWFERAMRFKPDDGNVRLVFGIQLLRDGKRQEAVQQLELAVKALEDDGNAHYNAGLAYFELGDYPKALEHAKQAEALGFTLPGLRQKLQRVGQWK